ncbi:MAG TPA: Ig-like domain-containing protein [Candidatus Dormibacteraeota bacterium]|jgi:hypothetical protein|nr:Ig-like domain-containing protein [Candidatus Dormibacteraeota bacterium]
MLFGHNTNVTVGDAHYHVQTEDRGVAHAVIDTAVYLSGRVVHRRTNNYSDLLPLDAGKEAILKQRVDEQHHGIEEELRNGSLKPAEAGAAATSAEQARDLRVELSNAANWLKGKQASLQVLVQDRSGEAVANANVVAHMEGAVLPVRASGVTGANGIAVVEFEMPALAGAQATLVMEASSPTAKGQLRFQLRARPKVPAV